MARLESEENKRWRTESSGFASMREEAGVYFAAGISYRDVFTGQEVELSHSRRRRRKLEKIDITDHKRGIWAAIPYMGNMRIQALIDETDFIICFVSMIL